MQESAEQFFGRLRNCGDATGYSDLRNCYEQNSEWDGEKYLKKEFPEAMPEDKDILFCNIQHYSYEGHLTVIYHKDGKFYSHSDGHCSCNGWDAVWGKDDAEVTLEWLVQELNKEKTLYEMSSTPLGDRKVLADYLQERWAK